MCSAFVDTHKATEQLVWEIKTKMHLYYYTALYYIVFFVCVIDILRAY